MTRSWKPGGAVVLALATVGALLVTPPATARPRKPALTTLSTWQEAAYDACPDHKVCVYRDKNFTGGRAVVDRDHPILSHWNNRISSVINRTRKPVCVYDRWHYQGRFPHHPRVQYYWAARHGDHWGYGGNLITAINDRVSSYRFGC